MRARILTARDLADAFSETKALTRKQLLSKLGCSWTTIWRLLKGEGYVSSYNRNGRYYTLLSIARFDDRGLWSCGTARFSRWGTLTRTIVESIRASEAGLHVDELHRLLRTDVGPTLGRLAGKGVVSRRKFAGRYLYLACEPETARDQFAKRRGEPSPVPVAADLPNTEATVALLVELIKTPGVEPETAARRLRRRGLSVSNARARAVFAHHGLLEKKRLI